MRPKKSNTVFSPEALKEREYYRNHRLEYFRDCLRVKDRLGTGIVPFDPLPGQRALMKLRDDAEAFYREVEEAVGEQYRRPISVQVLKARRGGFSTLIEAEMFHFCELNPGVNGLVVAHQQTNASNVAQISRRFEQQFPDEMKFLKIQIPKMGDELEWGDVDGKVWDSRIIIATASSKNFARGYDFSFVHLSECAHYQNSDAIAAAKDAAQFAKIIYEESTASGMDPYFYRSWENARSLADVRSHWRKHGTFPDGWNGKLRFFWSWWEDDVYRIPLTEQQKIVIMNDLSEVEAEGVTKYGWDAEQIEWRRRKIAGDCSEQTQMDPEDYFRQEYPSNPDEAFVMSGNAVYPADKLVKMSLAKHRVHKHGSLIADGVIKASKQREPASTGVVLWKEPKPGHQYVIGCRSAEGLKHTDYSVVIVFDRGNGDFLDEVACYRGQKTGLELGDIAAWLGYMYHGAYIIPEATRPATAQRLVQIGYPYVHVRKNEEKVGAVLSAPTQFSPGFKAYRHLYEMILDHSQDAFRKEQVFLKSQWCIREHMMFVNLDGDRKAPSGETDDGVICTAMAVYAHRMAAPKLIVPEDMRRGEPFQTPEGAKSLYERQLLEDIKKKKERSDRANRRRIKTRERRSAARLEDLFRK